MNLSSETLKKCRTGITGLDDMTNGGFPQGRPTLISGGPGCGKTVMSMEFLINGIQKFDEPGVFVSFEESAESLSVNFSTMGFDLDGLIESDKLIIDNIQIDNTEFTESSDFNLEPIFIRLNYAIDKIGAKRVAIDTIETLFSVIKDKSKLRYEIKRLFNWLTKKGVTSVITGERSTGELTKFGLEEFVSDCVIYLDQRVINQISKRRLRIIKYRGSAHSSDECPFIISGSGFSVLPITALELNYTVSRDRVPTGIKDLDKMLGGKGYFKGSSVLVSGSPGTGKSSLSSLLAYSACERGEKCLYISFEESENQIIRNMSSIGMDLESFVKKGLLHFRNERTTKLGLEEHLLKINNLVAEINPTIVIIDPISNFFSVGDIHEIKSMLTRVIDNLKKKGVTTFFTSLSTGDDSVENTRSDISSIMDTWLILDDYNHKYEKKRLLFLLKSRGMKHSREIKELIFTDDGIKLKKPSFELNI